MSGFNSKFGGGGVRQLRCQGIHSFLQDAKTPGNYGFKTRSYQISDSYVELHVDVQSLASID